MMRGLDERPWDMDWSYHYVEGEASSWAPCFCLWPRKLIDGKWGWGRLEFCVRLWSTFIPSYVHGCNGTILLYRKRAGSWQQQHS